MNTQPNLNRRRRQRSVEQATQKAVQESESNMPYLEKQPKLSITAKVIMRIIRNKAKKTLLVASVATSMLAATSNVNALGLGVLDIQSNLDQPLSGVITISVAPGDDLSSLEAAVASREEFEALGVDYPEYLKNIVLSVERSGAGGVLRVSSQDVVIKEPFIHFLVKVTWSGGSFIREYTALIDPPVYAAETPKSVAQPRAVGTDQTYSPTPTPQQQPSSQVSTPEQQTQPQVQAPAPQPVDQAVVSQPTAPASSSPVAEDAQYGPVAAGESLSLIAQELQRQVPDLSIYAIMQVLFEENRDAFIQGNINGLIKGSVLKIGDLDRIRNADLLAARQFFQQQVESWDPSYLIASSDRDSGIGVGQDTYSGDSEDLFGDTAASTSFEQSDSFQVGASSDLDSFVSSSEGGTDEGEVLALRQELAQLQGSLASSELENQELRERVSILEGQLADVNRLIDISVEDAELASLESNLAAQNNNQEDPLQSFESGTSDLLAEDTSLEVNQEDTVDDVLSEFLDDETLSASDDESANAENIETLDSEDELLLDDVGDSDELTLDDTQSVIEELDDDSVISTPPLDASNDAFGQDSFLDKIGGLVPVLGGIGAILLGGLGLFFLRRRKADEEFEISMLSIESNSQSIDIDTETGMSASMSTTASTSVLSDDTSTQEGGDKETSFLTVYSDSDAVVQADEVDPIAEADVYIAYGRDEQAEEVLLDGIASNPDRADVKQKLIGLYYKNKNVEGFERIAEELYGQADQIGADGWQEISDMGKELSPENPLFDLPPAEVAEQSGDSAGNDEIESVTEPVDAADDESADEDDLLVFDTVDESDDDDLIAEADAIVEGDATVSSDHSEMVVDSLNEDASIQLINFDDGRSEISELDEVEIDALAVDEDDDLLSFDSASGGDDTELDVGDELDLSEQIEDIEASDLVLDFDDQDSESDESSEAEFGSERRVSEVPEVSDLVIDPEYDESQTQYELAKVFVDLGDEDGARKILEELVSNPENSDELKAKSQELLDSMG